MSGIPPKLLVASMEFGLYRIGHAYKKQLHVLEDLLNGRVS